MAKQLDGIKKIQRAAPKNQTIIAPDIKNEPEPIFVDAKEDEPAAAKNEFDFFNFKFNLFNRAALAERAKIRRAERQLKKDQKLQARFRRAEERERAKQEKLAQSAIGRNNFIIKAHTTAAEAQEDLAAEKVRAEKTRRAKTKLQAAKFAEKLKTKEEKKKLKAERKILKQKERAKKIKKIAAYFKSHIKQFIVFAARFVVVILIITAALSYLVYSQKSTGSLVMVLTDKLPFPAVMINYQPVSYASYLKERRLFGDYYVSAAGGENSDKNKITLEKLIEKNIIKQAAKKYGVKLNEQEKEAAFKKFAETNGGEEQLTDKIYNQYGLTKDLFLENIIYYQALREKIKQAFIFDNKLHQGAATRMEKVTGMLGKNKADFETLAQKYSEDVHALQGGDIGYVKTNLMDEQLKTAAQNLNVGEISPVIKEENKYYIVKVYDKKINRNKEEEIWLKQITIFTNYDFESYLADLKAKAKVWVLISL
ncbi:MAG: peptidylprolyl isomerase [Patescibacteria group bacterium]